MIPFAEGDAPLADTDLVHHLVVEWRVRCAMRRAPWELTIGDRALALCVAVTRTLEQGAAAPGLSLHVRTWGAGVSSPEAARAALQGLGEAVSDLVGSGFGDFRPRGLDVVLQELAKEAIVPARRRTDPLGLDALTRCPGRRALERDLATILSAAGAAGEDVTLAVMELDTPPPRALRVAGTPEPSTDAQLHALLATLRATFGAPVTVYRVGDRAFAVLARAVGTAAMGESILLATCRSGPAFTWGTASLLASGAIASGAPDLLLLVAEADLHIRRRNAVEARRTSRRQRQLSVVSTVAAALLAVAGAAIGLSGTGHHQPRQEAAHARGSTVSPPAGAAVPTTTPPSPPPSTAGPTTVPGFGPPAPTPPASNTVLASFQTPAPAPVAPLPPPSPSGATNGTHGNSGNAPGHVKINGVPLKHA